jgi:hypothetical protein
MTKEDPFPPRDLKQLIADTRLRSASATLGRTGGSDRVRERDDSRPDSGFPEGETCKCVLR